MELRTAEQDAHDMMTLYESLRRHFNQDSNNNSTVLLALELPEKHPGRAILDSEENDESAAVFQRFSNDANVLEALESLYQKFPELEPKMKKFQKRLGEKDPITEKPRYGDKTAERVTNLLALHSALKRAVWAAYGIEEELEEPASADNNRDDNNAAGAAATGNSISQEDPNSLVSKLRGKVAEQEQAARDAELEAQRKQQEEEARQRAEAERQRQEEEARQRAEEERQRQEEAEAIRQAEEARRAERRAEREWVNSIPKGPEGVRQQIGILKEATADYPVAQKKALSALLQLFTQIAKHPEEINFRRIRRDHPKFNEDIGQYPGGKEILIAAGFSLATLEDVPCFFSKEPDLESDMDGWSAWFDNLKAILEVVKEMQ